MSLKFLHDQTVVRCISEERQDKRGRPLEDVAYDRTQRQVLDVKASVTL